MKPKVLTLVDLRESDIPEVYISPEICKLAESIDWESCSFRAVRGMATKNYRKLREAQPSSAFGQLLRAGIQTLANNWYQRYATTFQEIMDSNPSSMRQEYYPPLFGSNLPSRTGPGAPYSETQVVGLDREIINYKVMGGESFQRELFDDDQSGQIRSRAQKLGEAMPQYKEIYTAGRLAGTATTIAGVAIPASTFSQPNQQGVTVTTPFAQNLYSNTQGNQATTFSQLSIPTMKIAYEVLLNAIDPLGVKIVTNPSILLHSTFDSLNAPLLAKAETQPAVPGRGGENLGNAASGFAGWTGAPNPVKGLFTCVMNRYLPRGAWYIGEKKGLVYQTRDAMEITQEQPQSGQSFNNDVIRFRSRERFEIEWIDSRFWYQGNDGTASVIQ